MVNNINSIGIITNMYKVLVGIPTYFGNQLVTNCVASLLKFMPKADIYVLKNDMGWLKAANVIMETALDSKADVLLLNDDTYVLGDIVKELQDVAYSDDNIGIVGGKALAPNQDTVINYGIYVATDGNTAHRYYGKSRKEITEVEKQKAVEGSCFYVKHEVLNRIGFFDEGYGNGYREEIDYCFKAREAGYEVVSAPNAEYVHFVSQTNGKLGINNDTYDYFLSKWGRKLKLGEI